MTTANAPAFLPFSSGQPGVPSLCSSASRRRFLGIWTAQVVIGLCIRVVALVGPVGRL